MTFEQGAGKILIALSVPGSLAIAGWLHNDMSSLPTAIDNPSQVLAGISRQVADLDGAVRAHNTSTDASIDRLNGSDKTNTAAIATAQAELEDMRRERPEHENYTPVEPSQ